MSFAAVVNGALMVNKSFSGVHTDNQVVQGTACPHPGLVIISFLGNINQSQFIMFLLQISVLSSIYSDLNVNRNSTCANANIILPDN